MNSPAICVCGHHALAHDDWDLACDVCYPACKQYRQAS